MRERVRRPGAGDRKRYAIGGVAGGERRVQLLEARLFVPVDQHVDLRKRSLAIDPRLGYGVARELRDDFRFDLGDHLLLRLARRTLPLFVELLAEEERLPGARRLDLRRERAEGVDPSDERVAPALRIELDAERPFLFAVETVEQLRQDLAVLQKILAERRLAAEHRERTQRHDCGR